MGNFLSRLNIRLTLFKKVVRLDFLEFKSKSVMIDGVVLA